MKAELEALTVRVIEHIADAAEAFAWQAGVGAMETAGSIVSFLSQHPERVEAFMAGGGIMDWPIGWHEQGRLSWHGMDGKIHTPVEARRQRIIKKMEASALATPPKGTADQ